MAKTGKIKTSSCNVTHNADTGYPYAGLKLHNLNLTKKDSSLTGQYEVKLIAINGEVLEQPISITIETKL